MNIYPVILEATSSAHSLTEKCFKLRADFNLDVSESENGLFVIAHSEKDYQGFKDKFKTFEFEECEGIDSFIAGYTECMLWSSHDGELESLEEYELAPKTSERVAKDCRAFIASNLADLQLYVEQRDCEGYEPWECAGHDFWLTRCGHGAGFWDRGLDELGDRLSAASELAGNQDPYIGDDGDVYLS